MGDPDPSTAELRAVQAGRADEEREAAGEARTEDEERRHERRAEKAAYLERKLAEQERADRA